MNDTKGIKPNLNNLLKLRFYAKNLQLFKYQKVNSFTAGKRLSNAKGKGMDFDEVRHYQAGDDIRLMHWSLTAKLGKPFTKVYKEERQRSIYFVVDQSNTMRFGTKECFKSVKAIQAMALLGWSGINEQEKVGGYIFDENGYFFEKPSYGKKSLLKMFKNSIERSLYVNTSTNLEGILKNIYTKAKSGNIIIIISDFYSFSENTQKYIKLLTNSNEIINIYTYDSIEKSLPSKSLFLFGDGENTLEINNSIKQQQKDYEKTFESRFLKVKNFSKKYRIKFLSLATDDNLVKTINYGIDDYANK